MAQLLSNAQEVFAQAFSSTSGVDLNVARAWVLQENAGGSSNGANNWLGIGITGSGRYGYANRVWNNPRSGGIAAGKWLLGNPIGSGGYTSTGYPPSASVIQAIPKAGGPLQQILAIQASGWAAGGEVSLGTLYNEIVSDPQKQIPIGRTGRGSSPNGNAPMMTRPGGQTAGQSTSDVTSILSAWTTSEDAVPPVANKTSLTGLFSGVPILGSIPIIDDIPNPLDLFNGLSSGINDIVGFLKLLAWIINPVNILRMVEFLLGIGLMSFGIQAAVQGRGESAEGFSTGEAAISRSGLGRVSRELAAKTPAGRVTKAVKGKTLSPAPAPHRTRRTALKVRYEREQNVANKRTAQRRSS